MSNDASRHIPAAIKRAVRRRCRFGCVICGMPVFDYEHIIDFAQVQEHTAENITLLCPNHHRSKSSQRLPRDVIRKADANPYNGSRERTAEERQFFSTDSVLFRIGGNEFYSEIREGQRFKAIEFGRVEFVGFKREEDSMLLNLRVLDAVLNPILQIIDGELSISTKVNDFTKIGPNIDLRPAFAIKPIKIRFFENGISINSGLFYGWGRTLEVVTDGIIINPGGASISRCEAYNCARGIIA